MARVHRSARSEILHPPQKYRKPDTAPRAVNDRPLPEATQYDDRVLAITDGPRRGRVARESACPDRDEQQIEMHISKPMNRIALDAIVLARTSPPERTRRGMTMRGCDFTARRPSDNINRCQTDADAGNCLDFHLVPISPPRSTHAKPTAGNRHAPPRLYPSLSRWGSSRTADKLGCGQDDVNAAVSPPTGRMAQVAWPFTSRSIANGIELPASIVSPPPRAARTARDPCRSHQAPMACRRRST